MASIKYVAGTVATLLDDTQLSALASGSACSAGTEYDNLTNLWPRADFEAKFVFASAPADLATLDLYFIKDVDNDGTNFSTATTGASENLQAANFIGTFVCSGTGTTQYLNIRGVQGEWTELPCCGFKAILVNNTAVALGTSQTCFVKMQPYGFQTV